MGRRGVKKTRLKVRNRFNVLKPLFVSAEQLDVFLSPQLPVKRLRVNPRDCQESRHPIFPTYKLLSLGITYCKGQLLVHCQRGKERTVKSV